MAYSELIKSFHRIRPYMRSFYVYGFQHRTDYNEKSIRSYDNERRRIESWLGDYIQFIKDEDGKRVFLSVDSRVMSENPLYQAYKAKSFTDKDIMLHFLLLDMLDDKNGMCMNEVMDYLEEFPDIQFPDESSVRKKLKEYESIGIVRKEKQGKQVFYYRMTQNIALNTWNEAISFFSEVSPLGVIGTYIQDNMTIENDGNTDMQKEKGCFRYKHHYILNAIDSEVLCAIFLAMGEERTVILQNNHMTIEMVPLKIYISVQNGRQYVLGKTQHGFQFYRLDLLNQVKPGDKVRISDEIRKELEEFQSKVWGTATNDCGKTEHLEFVIHTEPHENFIVQRLHREKRNGTVTELGDGNWQFEVEVFDVLELLPWIRTFIGRIIRLETDNRQVKERFYEDLMILSKQYGGEEDAVF